MSVQVVIHADTAAEARSEMQAFLAGATLATHPASDAAQVVVKHDVVENDTAAPIKPPPARKPRGSKVTDVKDENEGAQAIQTGGDRVESEAEAVKALTVDDVRAAAKPYIDKFGMPAASSDLTPCLVAATGCKAISELADKDQATLQKAVDAFVSAGQASIRYGQLA